MWSKSNWCERLILISFSSLILLFCYNVFVQQVIYNPWLIVFIAFTIIFTIWNTCRDIQHLLELNAPIKIDSDDSFIKYAQINMLGMLFNISMKLFPPEKYLAVNNVDMIKCMCAPPPSDMSIIASVIERRCVWSWYSQYVSKEIDFPFACKQLLDQMVTKVFQVSYNIDSVGFYSDSLGIILKHCKEYKRAKKRLSKIGQGKIEEYYRNSHPTSPQRTSLTTCMKGKSTQSHCLLLTRSFLKELLPWELWGTPQSLLLASILAKRLDTYITTNLSNPEWIRNRLMKMIDPTFNKNNAEVIHSQKDNKITERKHSNNELDVTECVRSTTPDVEKMSVTKIDCVSDNVGEDVAMKTSIESALSNMISSSTAPILQRAELDHTSPKILLQVAGNDKNTIKNKPSQPINISGSPAHGKRSNGSNEVKIYDKVLEGSVKTWNSDNDLECVSLGHDLLASLDGDIETRFGRLWEADGVDGSESWSPNPPSTGSSTKTPHGLWFGDDDNLDMELTEDSPPKHNTNSHTSTSNTDEAAGVMEGILDFGMAGLRKGLRLTGLQESPTEKPAVNGKSSEVVSALTSTIGHVISRKNSHSDESFLRGENMKELTDSKGGESTESSKPNNSQHLIKQQRVTSQDSSYFTNILKDKETAKEKECIMEKDTDSSISLPFIDPIVAGTDSPEYEYEEPADFASTIAKLRHLLQQTAGEVTEKSQDDSNLPNSTNNHTAVPHSKPMSATQPTNSPIHKVTTVSQSQPSSSIAITHPKVEEIVSSPSAENDYGFTILSRNSAELVEAEEALNHKIEQISVTNVPQASNGNNMQRLDKLFTRTVTGVFNTIKTAVGGDSLADGVSGQPELLQNMNDKQTLVRAHQHKDDWIFIEGEMEVSKVVSKLLMERRGFCVVEVEVEAGQDTLEVLGGGTTNGQSDASQKGHSNNTTPTSPCVNDDLDESEVICGCPLYQMCMELVTVVLGGVMQKDAVLKCTSVVVADVVENILRHRVKTFNCWLVTFITESFHQLSAESACVRSDSKSDTTESQQVAVELEELCDALMDKIPDILFKMLGREEMNQAIAMLISSVEHPLINRDVIFNLLDVAMLHFVKASSNQNCLPTPPPSA